MKRKLFKLSVLLIVLVFFCSCGNTKVLRTREITNKITQTAVITESDIENNVEYENFFKEFSSDFTIPGLLEGIIPQGI